MKKLTIVQRNLTFSEALQALKERKWVRCPEWSGYWFLEAGKINVMKHDGTVSTTPWLEATVLREDWQIVEIDKEWQKEQQDQLVKMLHDFDRQPLQFTSVGRPVDLEPIKEGVPVMECSSLFRSWLVKQDIEWQRMDGCRTLILGNRDMFEIGCAWTNYKIADKANPKPKTRIESTPLGDIEVPE